MDKYPKYISQEQQEEFERFLLSQMELEEETIFHKKLDGNTVLKNQFEEFKTLFFAIEEEGLRKVLNDFHEAIPNKAHTLQSNFNLYRIAAGVAILVTLGFWFFNRPSQNEKLFEEYFTADPGLPTVMGSSDNYDFYEAMVDYKQGHYQVAIEKWETLLQEKPNNDTLNFFIGAAHLANENVDNAIKFLNPLTDDQNSVFYNEVNNFLGLALLKKGDVPEAKLVLSKSTITKSRELLSQLK